MEKTGLVLEGGGLRGVYTAGVLDYFMEKSLDFPYVIGVSAGASIGVSYASKQNGRSKAVTIDFVNDKRYFSIRNYFKEKSLFGMDFIFNDIPNKLVPFDYETFFKTPNKFKIGATNCKTGKSIYFDKEDLSNKGLMEALIVSTSIPFVSPIRKINGMKLLDGGLSDAIPIRKSIDDGNHKNVVILTRNRGYKKTPFKFATLAKWKYAKHPEVIKLLANRHTSYNSTLDYIDEFEENGDVFVIRPQMPVKVGRMERNAQKLCGLFQQGYDDAKFCYKNLTTWLTRITRN